MQVVRLTGGAIVTRARLRDHDIDNCGSLCSWTGFMPADAA